MPANIPESFPRCKTIDDLSGEELRIAVAGSCSGNAVGPSAMLVRYDGEHGVRRAFIVDDLLEAV